MSFAVTAKNNLIWSLKPSLRQIYRERRRWKYGVRSRYVVKPELVDSLMVHWVHASLRRSREVVVPPSAGVLAHFRQHLPRGIQLTGPRKHLL